MDLSGSSEVSASDVATVAEVPPKRKDAKAATDSRSIKPQTFDVQIDHARDSLLTDFGKDTLQDRYLLPGESFQDLFVRVASAYADDAAHAQRLYDYISKLWFMPATPVLSNGGTGRGLPISCYLNSVDDSLEGIVGTWNENVWLAARGGGIGTYWGNVRGIGEAVGLNGKTSGIIPFVRVMDSLTLAISQGSLRRGSAACYLDISHPEITLPSGKDQHGQDRTAVCCLSSLNLDTWDEWNGEKMFIEDVMRFLANVLQDYIDRAPDGMARAKYSAARERSVGLGVMGFHSFLQARGLPFEGAMAKSWNMKIFKHIRQQVDEASMMLAQERGPCPDAADQGVMERFSCKMAIAPTASISIIAGGTSACIEPIPANIYTHKTLSGSTSIRNPHLERLLSEKAKNSDQVWNSILERGGSVQHLDFLTA